VGFADFISSSDGLEILSGVPVWDSVRFTVTVS